MKTMKHPLAGKTVTIRINGQDPDKINGKKYRVEDSWMNVYGSSWLDAEGNPAALLYAVRTVFNRLPTDDRVLYGKVGNLGYLIHETEIEPEAK